MSASTSAEEVRRLLLSVAWRLWWPRLLRRLLLVAAAAAGIVGVLLLARPEVPAFADLRLVAALLVVACVAAVVPVFRPVTLARAATVLDRAYGLDERFSTALQCRSLGEVAMECLVLRDAARLTRSLDIGRVPRGSLLRPFWLAASLTAAAVLIWLEPGAPHRTLPTRAVNGPATSAVAGSRTAEQAPVRAARDSTSAAPAAPGGEGRALLQTLGLEGPRSPAPAPLAANRSQAATRASGSGSASRDAAAGDQPAAPSAAMPAGIGARAGGGGAATARAGSEAAPGSPGVAWAPASAAGAPGFSVGVAAPGGTPEAPRRAPAAEEAAAPSVAAASAAAGAAFGREPVPPALRHYIIRYFEILRSKAAGEPS